MPDVVAEPGLVWPLDGRRFREGLSAALTVLLGAALGGLAWRGTPDDFYITYRYANRLAAGAGFTYNPGERVFGTSDPAWGLLLALGHAVSGIDVAVLAAVLFGAALGALAWIAGREVRAASGSLSWAAGTLVVVLGSGLLWNDVGAAAALQLLAFLVAAILGPRRALAAGAIAACGVAVRPDGALALPLLAFLFWREDRRGALRFALGAGALVAVALGLAWLYFGVPLPGTFTAKRAMATAHGAGAWTFLGRASAVLRRFLGPAWWALPIGAIGGAVVAMRHGSRPARFAVLYGGLLLAFYLASGSPYYGWYVWIPTFAGLLGCGLAGATADGWLARRFGPRSAARRLGSGALAAGALAVLGPDVLAFARGLPEPFSPRIEVYRRAGEWLRAHAAADEAVAYVEIGLLGYVSERPVLDLMGLVSPEAGPGIDALTGFRRRPTPWVLFHTRGGMGDITSTPWFADCYRVAESLADAPPETGRLDIYRRLEPAPPRCGPARERPPRRASRP